MAALAEVEKGLAREVRLLNAEKLDDDAGSTKKNIALAAGIRPNLSFNDDGELNEIGGADEAAIGVVDEFGVERGFRFPKNDGGERRGVEDHLGRPCSS